MNSPSAMEAGVGPLSPPLRAIIQSLAENSSAMVRRGVEALREDIPEYADIVDKGTLLDIEESVAHNVRIWLDALLSGHPPTPEELEPLIAFSQRRVHQGVSLQSLTQALRSGSRVLWNALLETAGDNQAIHHELLFKVSPYILCHFDLIGRSFGQAYAEEQHKRARWRDRLQHELCAVIFSRPEDTDNFREHALSLGLDANASHLALALRLVPHLREQITPEAGLDKLQAAACRILSLERSGVLRAVRNGHVLLWLPLPAGEPACEAERRLAERAALLPDALADIARVGIGLPDSGASGWRRSVDQALRALDLGLRIAPARTAHRYLDFVIDDALAGTDNVTQLFESLIERLGPEPHLVKTLEAFFEFRQHRKAVAGALNIHPNTLSYRLERIETLLGARLDDIGWLSRLHAALRLHQISHAAAVK